MKISPDQPISPKTFILCFSFLIFLFLTVRINTLFLSPATFHEGELYVGTIAQELKEGKSWPFMLYQNEAHEGGSLIIGTISSIFFSFFGSHLIILKSVSIFFSFLSFLLFSKILLKYYDKQTCLIGALILSLAPPLFLIHATITMGKYYELIFLEMLSLYIFLHIFHKKHLFNQTNYLAIIFLGLINGLGLYFSYMHIIILMTFFIIVFIKRRELLCPLLSFLYLVSFLIGFLPWIIYNYFYGFKSLNIHQKNIFDHFHISFFPERLNYLIGQYIPQALQSTESPQIFSFLFMIAMTTAIVFILLEFSHNRLKSIDKSDVKNKKDLTIAPHSCALIYIGIFTLFFCLSDFKTSPFENHTPYKYLFTSFPYSVIIVSIFLRKQFLSKKIKQKIINYFLLFCLLSPAIIFLHNIQRNQTNTYLFTYRPYSYTLMGCNVLKFAKNINEQISYIEKIPQDYRKFAYRGYGSAGAEQFSEDLKKLKTAARKIPENFREIFYIGLFIGLAERKPYAIAEVSQYLKNNLTEKDQLFFYKGLGLADLLNNQPVSKNFQTLSTEEKKLYAEGCGMAAIYLSHYDRQKALEYLPLNERSYLNYFSKGMSEIEYILEHLPDISQSSTNSKTIQEKQ